MDNQQERSLAWLAGIIDGEGSISVQVYTLPDGRVRFTPYVCITNSDQGILDESIRIVREITKNAKHGKARLVSHSSSTNKPCFHIRLDGAPCCKLILEAVRPFLMSSKRKNADNVLAYIASRDRRLLQRDKAGHILRACYSREEVDLICAIRTHKRAKSSEAICQAPNVVG